MMHLQMIGLALAIAVMTRLVASNRSAEAMSVRSGSIYSWQLRWHRTLTAFVVPPLLLVATAVAVVAMGISTAHPWEGKLSYALAVGFLTGAIALWAQLVWSVRNTLYEIRRYPQKPIKIYSDGSGGVESAPVTGRILDAPAVFSAQVGLWSAELVVSQGLLEYLDDDHLAAVLAHESGHAYYRDTFWFFWLGGLRRSTRWLPHTEALWQDLLLLREIRADSWAVRRVDPLVLAESLMSVITAPLMADEAVCAGFSCAAPRSRLAQRVDALLEGDLLPVSDRGTADKGAGRINWQWVAIALSLSPLITIPFHY